MRPHGRSWCARRGGAGLLGAIVLVAAVAAACGGADAGNAAAGDDAPATPEPERTPGAAVATPPTGELPPLDRSRAIVPLEEVLFDTFDGGAVPLADAGEALIERLRDAIPPIAEPRYEDAAAAAGWLGPDDLVLGYVTASGRAYAYPVRILNFHEIVNEQLDGVPLLISYCPLCRSGVVYDRRLEGETLTFGNTSALFESDLVMYDHQTNSYWWQVAGRSIVGTLAGQSLTPLPSQTARWEAWREQHPETLVLSRETGFARGYGRDPFTGLGEIVSQGVTAFPTSERSRDPRLPPAEEVLGVVVEGAHRVYPLRLLGDAAVHDEVGGRRIVVFARAAGPDGSAYFAEADGRELTFRLVDGEFADEETGSVWDLGGLAVSGPLAGTRLAAPPSRYSFWFAYVGAFPDAEVFVP
jgi:hypothetical protein